MPANTFQVVHVVDLNVADCSLLLTTAQNHISKSPIALKLINLDLTVPTYGLQKKYYDEREMTKCGTNMVLNG
jgi:hypothetical protein